MKKFENIKLLEFLVINTIQNYPYLIGIHRQQLTRLRANYIKFKYFFKKV